MKHGYFDMATTSGFQSTPAYMAGPFAIHGKNRDWKLSHAATGFGIPGAYADTRDELADLASLLDEGIDWSTIKRGKNYGSISGMTKAKARSVRGCIEKWRAGLAA